MTSESSFLYSILSQRGKLPLESLGAVYYAPWRNPPCEVVSGRGMPVDKEVAKESLAFPYSSQSRNACFIDFVHTLERADKEELERVNSLNLSRGHILLDQSSPLLIIQLCRKVALNM